MSNEQKQVQKTEENQSHLLSQLALGGGTVGVGEIVNVMAHNPNALGVSVVLGLVAAVYSEQTIKVGKTVYSQVHDLIDQYQEKRIGAPNPKHIKNTLMKVAHIQSHHEDDEYADDGEDELRTPAKLAGTKFIFSDVLRDFKPSLDKIYIGETEDGTPLFCAATDLCHVALAGSTGNGKSSIIRLLMSQLCAVGCSVLLLNPHYTRYDRTANTPEDWTPYTPYLHTDPMGCVEASAISSWMHQIAKDLLPKRLKKYRNALKIGKPYFIVIDELPAILKKAPEVTDYIDDILREGRKVGIYLIVSSQDFLVKTIDPSGKGGGAVRDCYRTAFYTGGDATTAKILLDMLAKDIQEDRLGKGTVMLRSVATKKAAVVRVPYVDNEALYRLLGPSTYKPGRDEVEPDDELYDIAVQAPPTTPAYSQDDEADAALARLMGGDERTAQLNAVLAQAGTVSEETLLAMVDKIINSPKVVDADPPRPSQQQPVPPLSKELQKALALYQAGNTSYRSLGDAMGIDKDRAGRLIKELQELGFIEK